MDFLELAKSRYSCRNFSEKKVEKEKIDKIIEAARIAPTAVNFQPQKIMLLQTKEQLSKLKECTKYGWNAPIIFVICYDKTISWKRKYDGKDEGIIDASIVTTHMMLEAQDLGLGSTWIGSFDPEKLRKEYHLPGNLEAVALLAIGYPAKDAKPSENHDKRKKQKEIMLLE